VLIWLAKHRRCVRDYDIRADHHETIVYIAAIHILTDALPAQPIGAREFSVSNGLLVDVRLDAVRVEPADYVGSAAVPSAFPSTNSTTRSALR
jgi:hypothetical protein